MSTQITVTVAPNALMPAIPGGGLWAGACPRYWLTGTTTVTVSDAEVTDIEGLSALRREIDLLVGGDGAGRPGSFRRASPTQVQVVASDGTVLKVIGVPSTQVLPAIGAPEDPSIRTTIGQATYRALLADARFQVAVLP